MNTITGNEPSGVVDILDLAINVAESGRVGVALKIISDLSKSLKANNLENFCNKKPEAIFVEANNYILKEYLGISPDVQGGYEEEEDWIA